MVIPKTYPQSTFSEKVVMLPLDLGRYALSAIALIWMLWLGWIDAQPENEVPSTLYFCLTGITLWFTGKEMVELLSLIKKKIKNNL